VPQIGALICFIVIGIDVFFVMQSLGELSTMYPNTGAFTELAGRFIDPAVAVGLGWNYWYLVRRDQRCTWQTLRC
jgi:amino acid transporter